MLIHFLSIAYYTYESQAEMLGMSDDEIKSMSWTTFVSGCVEPELIEYLKERRIYVNEPLDAEEEI